jgi:uncharacterized protein (TIGR02452 family)
MEPFDITELPDTLTDINELVFNYKTPKYNQYPLWTDPHSPAIRQKVWHETLAHYKDYIIQTPTIKYTHVPTQEEIDTLKVFPKTDIEVINQDTFYATENLIKHGFKPMVLNMADWNVAGGCVHGGAKTQEEELFRRSNYYKHLLHEFYPLETYDLMVSSGVEVYRDGPDTDYAKRKERFKCNIIASPALDSPVLNYKENENDMIGTLNEDDELIMYNKIRQLIYYAAKHECDSIVLSAWGCGAFHLPASQIAAIFRKVLSETDGCLRKAVFAATNHKNNYDIFKSIIG